MERLAEFITLRQASKISGYNPDYLSFLIREGKMRGKKVGRNWVTTREDVKYYLANLSARQEISKKSSFLRTSFMVVTASLLVTFVAYLAYMFVYSNVYDQVSVKTTNSAPANSATGSSTSGSSSSQNSQTAGIVQTILQ